MHSPPFPFARPLFIPSPDLPCCWGTLSETFAEISDSLWFESADASTLYVALFASSTATWRDGAVVRQESGFPYAARATTTLAVVAAGSAPAFTLAIRVPAWATGANAVTVNGAPVTEPVSPGSFLLLARTWAAGDVVVALFPPALRFEPLNDARAAFAGVGAVMHGAMLLASVNSTSDAFPLPDTSAAGLARAFARVPAAPPAGGDYADLVFAAASDGCGNATFTALADVTFEAYSVYMHTSSGGPANAVGYNASGASVLSGAGGGNFLVSGGAAIQPNGADENIRSGDPGQTTSAAWATQVLDAAHLVTGFSLNYQYVAGYGGDGAPGGTTFEIVALDASSCGGGGGGPPLATLYSSPVLSHFPFDSCNTCYSPPMNVTLPRGSLSLNVSGGVAFAFRFTDNARNVQLRLPIDATVFWGA